MGWTEGFYIPRYVKKLDYSERQKPGRMLGAQEASFAQEGSIRALALEPSSRAGRRTAGFTVT